MTKRLTSRFAALSAMSLILGLAFSSNALAQAIQQVPHLPGDNFIFISNISDDGRVLTGVSGVNNGGYHAIRWTAATGAQSLGQAPGHSHSSGYEVSGDGQTVVGISGATYDVAARWTAATGMIALGSLAAGQPSFAFGVSQNGSVIVGDGYMADGTQRAWKWTSTTGMQPLTATAPGTLHSLALAVNGAGTHIIGYCYNNAPALIWPTGCMWLPGGAVVTMGLLPNTDMCVPSALTADGGTAIGYCSSGNSSITLPFTWAASTGVISALPLPAGFTTGVASSCTDDGSIITGYAGDGLGNYTGCVWQTGQAVQTVAQFLIARGIDTTGWGLTSPSYTSASINSTGSAMAGSASYLGGSAAWYVDLGAGCTAAPQIMSQPTAISVPAGATASFSVSATGGPLSYQWLKDASPIVGEVSSSLTFPAIAQASAGLYTCAVTNLCGTTLTSGAMLTINSSCPLPTISQQPVARTVAAGGTASFTVSASGGTLSYQWARNAAPINGEVSATLTLSPVTQANTGTYTCAVTNSCGTRTTSGATLTIGSACPLPEITLPPMDTQACVGEPVQLTIQAVNGGIGFQWVHDGQDVAGTRGRVAVLSIPQLSQADAGEYYCLVENDCGIVSSNTVTVTIGACQGCSLADIAGGGADGLTFDGVVDGSDFIAFINSFSTGDVAIDALADVAGGGADGLAADGIVDGSDFIAFINAFSAGC